MISNQFDRFGLAGAVIQHSCMHTHTHAGASRSSWRLQAIYNPYSSLASSSWRTRKGLSMYAWTGCVSKSRAPQPWALLHAGIEWEQVTPERGG